LKLGLNPVASGVTSGVFLDFFSTSWIRFSLGLGAPPRKDGGGN